MNRTPAPLIVGVDPGARHAGIVARRGRDLLACRRVERATLPTIRDLADALATWQDLVVLELADLVDRLEADGQRPDLVAVERTTAPRGHARGRGGHLIDVAPLIDTAHVGGAVVGWAHGAGRWARYVDPDRHGSLDGTDGMPPAAARAALLAVYDGHEQLVGPRTTRGTDDALRHLRSAYDVAGAAALLIRRRT